jgi:hypothetical protein
MKPTIGRIVNYWLPQTYWSSCSTTDCDYVRPAIVTRVLTDTRINLRVIHDPTDQFLVSAVDQVGVREGTPSSLRQVPSIAGTWSWPERSAS